MPSIKEHASISALGKLRQDYKYQVILDYIGVQTQPKIYSVTLSLKRTGHCGGEGVSLSECVCVHTCVLGQTHGLACTNHLFYSFTAPQFHLNSKLLFEYLVIRNIFPYNYVIFLFVIYVLCPIFCVSHHLTHFEDVFIYHDLFMAMLEANILLQLLKGKGSTILV